jgi:hypothetical protein
MNGGLRFANPSYKIAIAQFDFAASPAGAAASGAAAGFGPPPVKRSSTDFTASRSCGP